LPRRLAPAVSFGLLLGLFVYLFWVPLRPSAWDGPRGQGPFESEDLSGAGWFARDVRLPIERIATWRSPGQPLAATAEALLAFHALLAAGRFAVLWLLLRQLGGCGCLATLGVLAAALPIFCCAPRQNDWDVGLLLFVLLMAATTPTRIRWWVAVGGLSTLFVLWANAHDSVMAGLAWLGAITLGRAIEWWKSGATERPAVGRLLVAIVLCAAAACLNPDWHNIYTEAFRATKNPNIHSMPEWQPVDFSTGAGMPWGYFATLAGLLLIQLFSRRVLGPTALVVVLTFGFWPVVQQRGLGPWWLIVPWLAVPLFRARPEPEASARAEAQLAALADASGSGSWGRRVGPIAVAFAVLCTPVVRWLVLGPRELESIVSADTPARLALELTSGDGSHLPEFHNIVRNTYPDGRYRGAILTGEDQGDFLAWVLDGDNTRPVMLYSRPEAFDPGIWGEAQEALKGASPWWEILGRHQVNLIAIHPIRWEKLAGRLRGSKEWAIVEDGPALLVAVRKQPKLPAELQP
jgi:hypothetical protein